ncbi:MAG TPA: peptidylprolyl isomerase [archaeon]|nr:peptidylprolyl isomerase [archaeon]
MRKGMSVIFCFLVPVIFFCSKGNCTETKDFVPKPEANLRQQPDPKIAMPKEDEEVAVITTDFGKIILRFFPKAAPEHVNNFKSLAKSKFYDGTTFHRVMPGFMIQGGDPNSRDDDLNNDGTGRGPRSLNAEFNDIKHERGILSMARGMNPNSASCQFFIMVTKYPTLDNQYSVFGQVVKGMDVVDKIVNLPKNEKNNPGKASIMRSVTIERAGDVLELAPK